MVPLLLFCLGLDPLATFISYQYTDCVTHYRKHFPWRISMKLLLRSSCVRIRHGVYRLHTHEHLELAVSSHVVCTHSHIHIVMHTFDLGPNWVWCGSHNCCLCVFPEEGCVIFYLRGAVQYEHFLFITFSQSPKHFSPQFVPIPEVSQAVGTGLGGGLAWGQFHLCTSLILQLNFTTSLSLYVKQETWLLVSHLVCFMLFLQWSIFHVGKM